MAMRCWVSTAAHVQPHDAGRSLRINTCTTAPGIAETHVVGSEQFVCVLCGHVTRTDGGGAERFSFTFDKVRKEYEELRGFGAFP